MSSTRRALPRRPSAALSITIGTSSRWFLESEWISLVVCGMRIRLTGSPDRHLISPVPGVSPVPRLPCRILVCRMRIVVRISGSLCGCSLIGGRLWLDRAPGLPFIIGLAIGSILVLDWNSGTGNPGPQGLSSFPAPQATGDLYTWPLGVWGLIYLGLGPQPSHLLPTP